jgi:hypothetical protein
MSDPHIPRGPEECTSSPNVLSPHLGLQGAHSDCPPVEHVLSELSDLLATDVETLSINQSPELSDMMRRSQGVNICPFRRCNKEFGTKRQSLKHFHASGCSPTTTVEFATLVQIVNNHNYKICPKIVCSWI